MTKFAQFFLLLSSIAFTTSSPRFPYYDALTTTYNQAEVNSEIEERKVYRLPEDLVPIAYKLLMTPNIDKSNFSGNVEIDILVQFSTNRIQLHSKKLSIQNVVLQDGNKNVENKFKLDEANELLIIETTQELAFDKKYKLKIDFEGILDDSMHGFYRSSYTIDNQIRWLATTQFEPTDARRAFPCFDEPRFRATFSISILHESKYKATSNMLIKNSDYYGANRYLTEFHDTPPMATYLVSFMISDFADVSDADKKIRVWARKNAIQQTSYALGQSTKLLKKLEGYLGISFQLPKLDVVAVPDFSAGAMENWGMTTYRESLTIVDESNSAQLQKTRVTQVICHEFAHQWFGDLVTPAWWDYLWLNEGFATYFEYFGAAMVEQSWNLPELFVIDELQFALQNEIYVQRAMTSSVKSVSEIQSLFDVISYPKSASVIRMFEHMVSPSNFQLSLHNYLKQGSNTHNGTVVPAYLFEAFDNQCYRNSPNLPAGILPSHVMKLWTENIGYPLITVIRDHKTGNISIYQSAYKSSLAPKPAPDQQWIVPLTYTTKSQAKFTDTKPTLWLLPNSTTTISKTIPKNDWILFNIQQTGYYRVKYDHKSSHQLINQLNEDPQKIHLLNRAQIIDDFFTLAGDGLICCHMPLNAAKYLTVETNIIPFLPAIKHLHSLYIKYDGLPVQNLIQTFVAQTFQKPFEHFGFAIKPTDSHILKMKKPYFLNFLCELGVKSCVDSAVQEYNDNKNDLKKIQPELKPVVYCTALRELDSQNVFENLWKEYTSSNIAYDKGVILQVTSCTKDHSIIKTILSKLLDSKNKEIRKQDEYFIYRRWFNNNQTVNAALEFIKEKIPDIPNLDSQGIATLKKIFGNVKSKIKHENQLALLRELNTEFLKLDQTKYGEFTKIVLDTHADSIKSIAQNRHRAKHLESPFNDVLYPHLPPHEQPATDAPNSAASGLLPRLTIIAIVLYQGLALIRNF